MKLRSFREVKRDEKYASLWSVNGKILTSEEFIKNYKNISRETQENLDTLQIDKVLHDYNSSIHKSTRKIRKTNIQSKKILTTTSKTRSGKLYNKKEIHGSKTRSGKLFR